MDQLQLVIKVIIFLISLAIIIEIIGTILAWKRATKTSFKCPNCGHIFKPDFLRFPRVIFYVPGVWYGLFWKMPALTRCPKCGKRSWHSVIKDSEIEGK